MSGVRKFDEEAVLDTVMTVFWRDGYGATSMADLAAATGVQRGSLYHAYGGKEDLLLRALDHYGQRHGAPVRQALRHPDPVQAMACFLDSHLRRMADPSNPSGCLMCQTALECGGRDPAPSDRVRAHFRRTETALREALECWRADGRLSADTDAAGLARFYLGVSRGMAVLHRAYGDLDAARDVARTALSVLAGRTTPTGIDPKGRCKPAA